MAKRCHQLTVGNTAEQLAIVTDTKIHVSFSLFSWSIWAENALLCFLRELDTKADRGTVPESYTPTSLSAQLGSVQIIIIFAAFAVSNAPPGCLQALMEKMGHRPILAEVIV